MDRERESGAGEWARGRFVLASVPVAHVGASPGRAVDGGRAWCRAAVVLVRALGRHLQRRRLRPVRSRSIRGCVRAARRRTRGPRGRCVRLRRVLDTARALRRSWAPAVAGSAVRRERMGEAESAFGVRIRAAGQGSTGPTSGARPALDDGVAGDDSGPVLVARGPTETLDAWRARWVRTPEVTYLQAALNEMGAELVVDGVYGPATDAAVRTCAAAVPS